ncbi:uncharacterized protein FOMMEDRAFT_113015 [Fomitiporia mediterranea MF3/22]|uniref:uncharacterized protein n=1 Tax=Fomitiporia mediterranea (strain MF3/22) TaxID=694068 RepID=UPI0004407BB8|nr:uncharacterized protein FOMMEDRAFT_113015 [Fomitiporia mediterranea MF3/22]EJC99510.1 hypothetical protein FOMMEDRAFT_113015 [Fomitiporia mediterranea MF3/22]
MHITNDPLISPSASNPALISSNVDEATSLLEKPNEPLWYLAYGSNLYSAVFKARRKITPLEERHVLVEGLELTFDLPGIPYLEPRFANCRFSSESEHEKNKRDLNGPWTGKGALIGVAYLVTPEDFARVIATEGGGAGYKMVSVKAQVFRRTGKTTSSDSDVGLTGETVHAFTLLALVERTRQCPGQPSPRYLTLIRKGAEEHSLPPRYREYLSSFTPYSPTTLRQKVGRAVSLATWVPPMLAFLLLGQVFTQKDGSHPQWLINARLRIFKSVWTTYDGIMQKLFGDGEQTVALESSDSVPSQQK